MVWLEGMLWRLFGRSLGWFVTRLRILRGRLSFWCRGWSVVWSVWLRCLNTWVWILRSRLWPGTVWWSVWGGRVRLGLRLGWRIWLCLLGLGSIIFMWSHTRSVKRSMEGFLGVVFKVRRSIIPLDCGNCLNRRGLLKGMKMWRTWGPSWSLWVSGLIFAYDAGWTFGFGGMNLSQWMTIKIEFWLDTLLLVFILVLWNCSIKILWCVVKSSFVANMYVSYFCSKKTITGSCSRKRRHHRRHWFLCLTQQLMIWGELPKLHFYWV